MSSFYPPFQQYFTMRNNKTGRTDCNSSIDILYQLECSFNVFDRIKFMFFRQEYTKLQSENCSVYCPNSHRKITVEQRGWFRDRRECGYQNLMLPNSTYSPSDHVLFLYL
jgi:hypothetical protein